MRNIIIVVIIIGFSFGCKRENSRGCSSENPSTDRLKGNWKDYRYLFSTGRKFTTSPIEEHFFHFIGSDSFNLKLTIYDDDTGSDSCDEAYKYNYVAGKYTLNGNRIYLKGNYTDFTYAVEKNSGCDSVGKYDGEYIGSICNDTLILERLKPRLLFSEFKYVKMYKM